MSSTYTSLPKEDSGSSTTIVSDSPAIIISHHGSGFGVGVDPDLLIAERAAAVVNDFTAGETISALQAVYQASGAIYKAAHDTLEMANAIGVALTSGGAGDTVTVLQYGVLTDPSFAFSPADLLFVSSNGVLSTIAPSSGYLTRVGRAITSTTALIIIDSPKTL